jgi:hypothetical protein
MVGPLERRRSSNDVRVQDGSLQQGLPCFVHANQLASPGADTPGERGSGLLPLLTARAAVVTTVPDGGQVTMRAAKPAKSHKGGLI